MFPSCNMWMLEREGQTERPRERKERQRVRDRVTEQEEVREEEARKARAAGESNTRRGRHRVHESLRERAAVYGDQYPCTETCKPGHTHINIRMYVYVSIDIDIYIYMCVCLYIYSRIPYTHPRIQPNPPKYTSSQ